MRRLGWLVALVPSVALGQAGLGTGGSTSGNYTGGVSDSEMPRDPTQVGRVQSSRTPPLAEIPGTAGQRDAAGPDANRLRDGVRPEEGKHVPKIRPWKSK